MKGKLKASVIGMIFTSLLSGMFLAAAVQTTQAKTVLRQSGFNQWMYARYRKKRGVKKGVRKSVKVVKRGSKTKKVIRRARRS